MGQSQIDAKQFEEYISNLSLEWVQNLYKVEGKELELKVERVINLSLTMLTILFQGEFKKNNDANLKKLALDMNFLTSISCISLDVLYNNPD